MTNKKHIENIKDRRYDRAKELKYMREDILNKIYV